MKAKHIASGLRCDTQQSSFGKNIINDFQLYFDCSTDDNLFNVLKSIRGVNQHLTL
jgi:hypothetical protein